MKCEQTTMVPPKRTVHQSPAAVCPDLRIGRASAAPSVRVSPTAHGASTCLLGHKAVTNRFTRNRSSQGACPNLTFSTPRNPHKTPHVVPTQNGHVSHWSLSKRRHDCSSRGSSDGHSPRQIHLHVGASLQDHRRRASSEQTSVAWILTLGTNVVAIGFDDPPTASWISLGDAFLLH
jgi:hypothetical protein